MPVRYRTSTYHQAVPSSAGLSRTPVATPHPCTRPTVRTRPSATLAALAALAAALAAIATPLAAALASMPICTTATSLATTISAAASLCATRLPRHSAPEGLERNQLQLHQPSDGWL
ncbi:hypothetical protein OAO87_03665 [bacterium]|nr:hypothetical protein [bacterium]